MGQPRHSILLVDEHLVIRAALALGLERAGFETLGASSPAEALQLVRSRPISAVLLDVDGMKQDGLKTLEALREKFHEVPVLVLAGSGHYSNACIKAVIKGANGCIDKTMPTKNLIQELNRVLGLYPPHLPQSAKSGSG